MPHQTPSLSSVCRTLANQLKPGIVFRNLLNVFFALALAVSALGIFQPVAPVSAATFIVMSNVNDGPGTLRAAIANAASGDTITFDPSVTTINLFSELVINKNLTITGPTTTGVTIRGGSTYRIFNVTAGKLNLNWINLVDGSIQGSNGGLNSGGSVSGLGGAVYVASGAVFTATNVTFVNNKVTGGNGGNGVYLSGSGGGGGAGGAPTYPGQYGGGGGGGSSRQIEAGPPAVYQYYPGQDGGFGGGGGGAAYGTAGMGGGGYGGNGSAGHPSIPTGVGANGGGGGAALGGALFIAQGAMVGLNTVTFTSNSATGGAGGNGDGSYGGGAGGGGAALGSAIFNDGDLCQENVTFSGNTLTAGAPGTISCFTWGGTFCPTAATAGQALDTSTGVFNHSGGVSCGAWFNKPTDIAFTPAALAESQPAGTLAGTFASTDEDPGDEFTYTLVSGTGSTDNASFAVSSGTNQLVTAAPLDYETKSSYSVRVRTTDSHGGYYEEAFTITITAVNDPPAISLGNSSINENAPINSVVGELTSTDPEGNSVTYSLPAGGGAGCEDNASFAIDTAFSPTIYLVTTASFDRETKSSYSICVRGTDNGTPAASADQHFTITVDDWNEAPTDMIASFSSPLNENMGSAADIATISTSDDQYGGFSDITYSLVSGTGDTDNSLFYFFDNTLRESNSLDYENKQDYSVRVRATDYYGLTYDEVFTFSIGDVDDAPTGIGISSDSVAENQPSGTTVGTMSTTDQDTTSFTYALTSAGGCPSTDNSSFDLSTAGVLTTKASFNYETKDSYQICVQSNETGAPSQYVTQGLTISVADVDEAPTSLSFAPDGTGVLESQAGLTAGVLSFTDPDTGETMTYTLPDDPSYPDNAYFVADGSTLKTLIPLDYESRGPAYTYSIKVRATDSGGLFIENTFTVTVLNSADGPTDITFTPTSLSENMSVGTLAGTLAATDIDSTTFTYTLASGAGSTDNSRFDIPVGTNTILTAVSLDYETKSTYSVRVRATDPDGLWYEEIIPISITNLNEPPTDIAISSNHVAENLASGATVGTLSSTDGDSSVFTYAKYVTAGCDSTDNDLFTIGTGDALQTAATFDYESKSSYQVCISSTDDQGAMYYESLTIQVNDTNDAPTDIAFTPVTLNENAANATAGTLSFTDPDPGDSVTYSLPVDASYPDNALFQISGSDIQTVSGLNYEDRPTHSYSVRVVGTDFGSETITESYTIVISNVNETPTDITFTPAMLYENQSGASAGSLATTDEDEGDTFTYTLVSGTGDTDNGSFTISGSSITTSAALDYETKSSYSVRVHVADAGGLSYEEVISIALQNVNEPPTDIALSNATVAENQASGTTVGTFSSTDGDSSSFTYTLITAAGCDSTDNASFSINASGDLLTAAVLNFETKSAYHVCVQSADSGSANYHESFTITATDANDAPTDLDFTPVTLNENAANATAGTLSFTDPDAGDTVTYSLPVDASYPDNALFQISGSDIQTVSGLDYEERPTHSYSVRVIGTDTSGATITESYTIVISNVNETPTDITFTPVTLNENQSGASAGSLATTDVDDSDTFTYSLSCSTPGADDASFTIATGSSTITTASGLDYETQTSYTVCVRSTDAGGLYVEKQFTITLQDVNEAPTSVSLTPAVLQENQANALAGTLSFTDPDAGDTVTYSLVAGTGDIDNTLFTISGNELRTVSGLNYEDKVTYFVRIAATDVNGLSYSDAFTVNITDVNDAPTDITFTAATVNEGDPAGTSAGTLAMVDEDAGDTATYNLVSGTGDTDNGLFNISSNQIQTADVFNYETQSVFHVRVSATDGAGQTVEKELVIHLTNVNETPTADKTIPNKTIVAGSPFSFTFAADTFSDPDGDALTYTATLDSGDPLPSWLALNGATRNFSGTPIMVETITVRVTADDGNGASVYTDFQITVNAVAGNHNPVVVNPIANTRAEIGDPFSYTFAANTFADYDGDALTYLATQSDGSPLPAWLTFNSGTRTFSGTPGIAEMTVDVKLTALDGNGGQVSTTFQLGVGEENIEPSVNILIPDQGASRGALWTYQVPANSFTDPEGDALTYSASLASGAALPSWLTFDAATRTFSGTPPETGQLNYFYSIRVTVTDGVFDHEASDTFVFGPWSSDHISAAAPAGTDVTIVDSLGSGPATNPARTTRLNYTVDINVDYEGEEVTAISGSGIRVCFHISPSDSAAVSGNLSRLVIGTSHAGADWTLLPTSVDSTSTICAYSTQFSLFDVFQRAVDISGESVTLPNTGFAPGRVTMLPEQPVEKSYSNLGDVWFEIPALDVQAPIIGVPLVNGEWDVSWLWENAGWLEGTAYPGLEGNSVLSGHVVDSNGNPDIFSNLGNLRWGSQIIVHVYDQVYTYEVRSVNQWVTPDDMSALKHEDRAWLTLVTCHGYDEETGEYDWRTVVRAVLVKTEAR